VRSGTESATVLSGTGIVAVGSGTAGIVAVGSGTGSATVGLSGDGAAVGSGAGAGEGSGSATRWVKSGSRGGSLMRSRLGFEPSVAANRRSANGGLHRRPGGAGLSRAC